MNELSWHSQSNWWEKYSLLIMDVIQLLLTCLWFLTSSHSCCDHCKSERMKKSIVNIFSVIYIIFAFIISNPLDSCFIFYILFLKANLCFFSHHDFVFISKESERGRKGIKYKGVYRRHSKVCTHIFTFCIILFSNTDNHSHKHTHSKAHRVSFA